MVKHVVRAALVGAVLAAGAAGQTPPKGADGPAKPPPRRQVAVASFALPKAFDGVASAGLVDLLLKAAKDSPRYEAVLPNDHLAALLDRARLELSAGRVPKGTDKDKLGAPLLLIPSASRSGKTTVLTATLVDLARAEVVTTVSAEATGEPDAVFELVGKLWEQVDTPCTGSFRVVTDGELWDAASSRAVVYDGRDLLLERVRRIKPAAKRAQIVFRLAGTGLLKSEVRFRSGRDDRDVFAGGDFEGAAGAWDHDAAASEHLLPFEGDFGDKPDVPIWQVTRGCMENTGRDGRRMAGVFYLLVRDRFGGTARLDLQDVEWTGSPRDHFSDTSDIKAKPVRR